MSTHILLTTASHTVTSNFTLVGNCNSTKYLEGKRTEIFVKPEWLPQLMFSPLQKHFVFGVEPLASHGLKWLM